MLTVGFSEKHQRCLYETIEPSSSFAPGERPEGAEPVAMREDLPEPTLVPYDESPGDASFAEEEVAPTPREEPNNGGSMGDSANEVDNIFVRPPSCAKMGEMLRQIPRGSDFDLPPSKMFEIAEMVIKFPFFVLNV